MVNAQLQIGIVLGPEPDPENPMRAVLRLHVVANWVLNGGLQPCEDRALVARVLRDADKAWLDGVQFDPPKILAVATELPPGAQ